MRDLQELNINEKGWPVDRPAPSQSDVESFENVIGASLPDDYKALLNHSNGGHPELDTFVPVGANPDNTWAVNRFYHLNPDCTSLDGLWGAFEKWKNVLGKGLVPVASDSGSNQIVLDFNEGVEPSVKLCIHDQNFKLIDVASSFGAFLYLLDEDTDMI